MHPISARGFWCFGQKSLFGVRVLHSMAIKYRNLNLREFYSINDNERKKQYNKRFLSVEHGTLVPLVMLSNSGSSRESVRFNSKLPEETREKRQ